MENPTKKSNFISAYNAGRGAVLSMPRWKFLLVLFLAMGIGNAVEKWLVAKYSFSEPRAFLLSLIAVALFGLLVGPRLVKTGNDSAPTARENGHNTGQKPE